MTLFTKMYGARPLHLVTMVAVVVLIGYVISVAGVAALWNPSAWWQSIIVWFVGAAVAHDLVLFPLYALADRVLVFRVGAHRPTSPTGVPVLNYVRIPLLATALTFLLFFPGIIARGPDTYTAATGQNQEPFLSRWLILVAVMFAVSALAYTARAAPLHYRRHRSDRSEQTDRHGTA